MEMCYDGSLIMPANYVTVNSEEMEYVDGGSARDVVEKVLADLIVVGICAIGKHITKASVLTALRAVGSAANAVWTCVKAACAFVWNHPALVACLAGAVGIGVGLVISYYHFR